MRRGGRGTLERGTEIGLKRHSPATMFGYSGVGFVQQEVIHFASGTVALSAGSDVGVGSAYVSNVADC